MPSFRQAFVGVGANLGQRRATIDAAMARLRADAGIRSVVPTPLFETDPIGVVDQPLFLNLVAGVETTLSPEALLDVLQAIEHSGGRVRVEPWGPRTLDLDLLAFESETRATGPLQLPHPRMLERNFVVVPLSGLLIRSPFRENPAWDELRALVATASACGAVRQVSDL